MQPITEQKRAFFVAISRLLALATLFSAGAAVSTVHAQTTERFFVRGDVDGDGRVGLIDAIDQLSFLFGSGNLAQPCRDAADANDDGQISLSDVTVLLTAYVAGTPLPAPSAQCGPDPSADLLDCVSTSRCVADFTDVVVIGDSLSAGFASGGLSEVDQAFCFPAQVVAAAGATLTLPLVSAPGFPNQLQLVAPGLPPQIIVSPGAPGTRIDATVAARNVAVSGAEVLDALEERPDLPIDSSIDVTIGQPWLTDSNLSLTQVEVLEMFEPSVAFVWLGANDALEAAALTDPLFLTDPIDFALDYATMMARVDAASDFIVCATIPDPSTITFLIDLDTISALAGQTPAQAATTLGVDPAARITLTAVSLAVDILNGTVSGPMPGFFVLTPAEAADVAAAVAAYNAVIRAEAILHDAVVVEVATLFDQIAANGVQVGPVTLTNSFLGGISSLDGIHPTRTGQALIASAYVDAIQAAWSNPLTPIDVDAVRLQDPLSP